MVRLSVRPAFFAAALLCAALAPSVTTKVIPASDLAKRVPMRAIVSRWSGAAVKAAGFALEPHGDRLLIHGRDKRGMQWTATLSPALRGIWRIDHQGARTDYLVGYTGDAGLGPPTWVLALTFDQQGRPVPFYLEGYAQYDANGISDLVELDGTGPQLIQQDWCDTNWDRTIGAQSGFWITTLYQQRDGFWRRMDGRHGSRTYPLFEKWSRWSPTGPVLAGGAVRTVCNPDYGNDPANGIRARIRQADANGIRVDPPADCRRFQAAVVVHDSSRGREIEMETMGVGPLLRRLATSHESVLLTGVSRMHHPPACSVSVIWSGIPD